MKNIELTTLEVKEMSIQEQQKHHGGITPLVTGAIIGVASFTAGLITGISTFCSLWFFSSKMSDKTSVQEAQEIPGLKKSY